MATVLGRSEDELSQRLAAAAGNPEAEAALLGDAQIWLQEAEVERARLARQGGPTKVAFNESPLDYLKAGGGFVSGLGLSAGLGAYQFGEAAVDLATFGLEMHLNMIGAGLNAASGGLVFQDAPTRLNEQLQFVGDFVDQLPQLVKDAPGAYVDGLRSELDLAHMALDANDPWAAGVLFGKVTGDAFGFVLGVGGLAKGAIELGKAGSRGIAQLVARLENPGTAKIAAATAASEGKYFKLGLPERASGPDYWPNELRGMTEAQRMAHIRGYVNELDLANTLNSQQHLTVLRYGDRIGTNGSDVIAYNSRDMRIELYDAKYRSNSVNVGQSPTFTQASRQQAALDQARRVVTGSQLPADHMAAALRSLQFNNYQMITVPGGAARNAGQWLYTALPGT